MSRKDEVACALLTDERLFGTTRLLDPEPRYRRVRHRLGLHVVLRALAAVFACGQECPVGRKLGFGQDYTISAIYRTVRITDPCFRQLWQTTTIGWSHQTFNPRMLGVALIYATQPTRSARRFARPGCGVVRVDSRGVDARRYAVGVAAEAPQLLGGQDVDDE